MEFSEDSMDAAGPASVSDADTTGCRAGSGVTLGNTIAGGTHGFAEVAVQPVQVTMMPATLAAFLAAAAPAEVSSKSIARMQVTYRTQDMRVEGFSLLHIS